MINFAVSSLFNELNTCVNNVLQQFSFFFFFSSPNAILRLRFNHFATECSWDHMYVYDGDSIYAPLIAVFR